VLSIADSLSDDPGVARPPGKRRTRTRGEAGRFGLHDRGGRCPFGRTTVT